jgi:hypothetical protein
VPSASRMVLATAIRPEVNRVDDPFEITTCRSGARTRWRSTRSPSTPATTTQIRLEPRRAHGAGGTGVTAAAGGLCGSGGGLGGLDGTTAGGPFGPPASSRGLEQQLGRELDLARRAGVAGGQARGRDDSERGSTGDGGARGQGEAEVRVVEYVERLRPELEDVPAIFVRLMSDRSVL